MTAIPEPVRDFIRAAYMDLAHPESVIYFVLNPDTAQVKIGRTRDLRKRLVNLRTAVPRAVLLGSFPGGATAEGDVHASFQDDRVAGEWFRMSPGLARFILALKDRS